jgi:hypothetical protein
MTASVSLYFRVHGNATSIGMPAEEVGPGLARLVQPPAMAVGGAKGDVVRTRQDADGTLWAEEKVESSGHSAVRLRLVEVGPLGELSEKTGALLHDGFAPLGVTGFDLFGTAFLDIPPGVDVAAVRGLLDEGARERRWEYEELFVAEWFRG